MIVAVGAILFGMAIVLWAQWQSERAGQGGGWGGLVRTAILVGGAFALYIVLAAGRR